MSQPTIPEDLRRYLPTDPHLADLVELRAIANGTEAEAYTWPHLMARLNEMIRQRRASLSVGAPTHEE